MFTQKGKNTTNMNRLRMPPSQFSTIIGMQMDGGDVSVTDAAVDQTVISKFCSVHSSAVFETFFEDPDFVIVVNKLIGEYVNYLNDGHILATKHGLDYVHCTSLKKTTCIH